MLRGRDSPVTICCAESQVTPRKPQVGTEPDFNWLSHTNVLNMPLVALTKKSMRTDQPKAEQPRIALGWLSRQFLFHMYVSSGKAAATEGGSVPERKLDPR
jgi:hypothetical protein